jgi:chromosome segregation ATPase
VIQKRAGQNEQLDENTLALAEAARVAAQNPPPKPEAKPGEEHMSLFWRVFGGTILSMVAIGAFTLYNNLSSNLAELRADLSREREARASLVKKDEFDTRNTSLYERFRSFDPLKAEHEGFKERANSNTAAIDALKKDTGAAIDSLRKDLVAATDVGKRDAAALDVLKERVAGLESVKKDVAGLDGMKEKLTAAVADLKVVRDELNRVEQDIERNKVADLERKASRDAQYKQIDDAIKELQRGLQDCREKLARFEGMQPTQPARTVAQPQDVVGPPVPKSGDPKGM